MRVARSLTCVAFACGCACTVLCFRAVALPSNTYAATLGELPLARRTATGSGTTGYGDIELGIPPPPPPPPNPSLSAHASPPSAPPLPGGALPGGSEGNNGPHGAPQTAMSKLRKALTPKPIECQLLIALASTCYASQMAMETAACAPAHAAMGLFGGACCSVATLGAAARGEFHKAAEYAGLTLAKPVAGISGGAGLAVISGLECGVYLCNAMCELALSPAGACRSLLDDRSGAQRCEECRAELEEWKRKQDEELKQVHGWHKTLKDFCLYHGPEPMSCVPHQ